MPREKKVEQYDVVIIGGGASGLTAGIYCGRARLKTIVIEQALVGGIATNTNEIENYPGFPEGITGTGLMKLFEQQAKKFGVKFKLTNVKTVDFSGDVKIVETFRNRYEAKAVIIANGSKPRLTGAENEEMYIGKGIAFCATCDAAACTDEEVLVIGSGDAAIEEGMFLTKFAKKVKVSVIHDEGIMDCNEVAKAAALANPKMEFIHNTVVERFEGEDELTTVVLKNLKTGELMPIDCFTCFLFIGYIPNTSIYEGKVKMSKRGYILTSENMETSVPGVFAAGDVREKFLRQVATCVGDAATAGVMVEKYIAETEIFENVIMKGNGIAYIYDASKADHRDFLSEIEELEHEYGEYVCHRVDTYKSKGLAQRMCESGSCPTVVVIKNGHVVKVLSEDNLEKKDIEEHL
ncbi:MAG: FAD-dependent oxidoreductase [Clostridia bacterium]|nr:FAD-dependent oxidoreductase [Clostridia bacterium]